ncbi:TIGR03118 family protein [Trinickia violacea]|uniref:TIGR03118 family protein n=1 Tax=Trinickia violacea TaxID=2571746 RepID=A0A4P8IP39_9BURK|nr:TIGR03118 family protein [Trinickia violacea]QCP50798.1 TIGR03118 family protein [Trinickia violacea]
MKSVATVFGLIAGGVALATIAACGGGSSSTPTLFTETALVSDGAVPAAHTDPNLQNSWGIAFNPAGFFWVADNGTSVATLYDGNGVPQTLVVTIPPGIGGPADPTGIVFNGTQGFSVSQGGKTGVPAFIFDGEGGTITAWSPAVNPTVAIIAYDDGSGGAVYKGLALAANGGANFLYATDFHNNKIDVFDTNFAKVAMPGKFQDPSLPAGFAPFGIQLIGSKLFVTYAMQNAAKHDDVAGAGLGFVDVYDTAGNLLQHFVSGGHLNAPWGIAQAPGNFGNLSGDILIGNFGDGLINVFNSVNGAFITSVTLSNNTVFKQDGLWGIAFGNGLQNQPTNTLFFAAGPNQEADGVFGRLDLKM